MDLDTTLTVIAGNLYRLLARKLPRYENATPDKIWRHFLDATGTRRRTGTGARARSRHWCARSAPERCTARKPHADPGTAGQLPSSSAAYPRRT